MHRHLDQAEDPQVICLKHEPICLSMTCPVIQTFQNFQHTLGPVHWAFELSYLQAQRGAAWNTWTKQYVALTQRCPLQLTVDESSHSMSEDVASSRSYPGLQSKVGMRRTSSKLWLCWCCTFTLLCMHGPCSACISRGMLATCNE